MKKLFIILTALFLAEVVLAENTKAHPVAKGKAKIDFHQMIESGNQERADKKENLGSVLKQMGQPTLQVTTTKSNIGARDDLAKIATEKVKPKSLIELAKEL